MPTRPSTFPTPFDSTRRFLLLSFTMLGVAAGCGPRGEEVATIDDPSGGTSGDVVAVIEPVGDETVAAPPTNEPSPAYVDAVARQALRLRRLQFLESDGVAEIRWTDRKGNHFEQCDLTLYLMPPWKTALNISKLGERFAWIGSDETQWWFFQLHEKPTSVEVHPWEEGWGDLPEAGRPGQGLSGGGMSIVSPRAILHLAGLGVLPDPASVTVREDAKAKTIIVEGRLQETPPDADGVLPVKEPRFRWTLDAESKLPTRIEILDESGATAAMSTLSEYVTAPIDGAPPGDFPRVPRRIAIVRHDNAKPADQQGSLTLTLDAPTARGTRTKPRYFRLPELVEAFRPDDLYYITPMPDHPTPTEGPSKPVEPVKPAEQAPPANTGGSAPASPGS